MLLDFFKKIFFFYCHWTRNIRQLSSLKMLNSEISGDTNISIVASLQHQHPAEMQRVFFPFCDCISSVFNLLFFPSQILQQSAIFKKQYSRAVDFNVIIKQTTSYIIFLGILWTNSKYGEFLWWLQHRVEYKAEIPKLRAILCSHCSLDIFVQCYLYLS